MSARQTEPNPRHVFFDAVGPWHDWFAWYPIRTYDYRLCWMRFVRRRRLQKHYWLHGGPDHAWQYHCEDSH